MTGRAGFAERRIELLKQSVAPVTCALTFRKVPSEWAAHDGYRDEDDNLILVDAALRVRTHILASQMRIAASLRAAR